MDVQRVQTVLNANGFPAGLVDGVLGPITKGAVARFQTAYAGPLPFLEVDGIPGPKTQAALEGLPRLSYNFTASEMACHHCGKAYVHRELLAALEDLRQDLGAALPIVSGYRCPDHNRSVGGALHSMHVEGWAADIGASARVAAVVSLELFSGVGDRAGIVRHVDLRHRSANNLTPKATPRVPARWHYT